MKVSSGMRPRAGNLKCDHGRVRHTLKLIDISYSRKNIDQLIYIICIELVPARTALTDLISFTLSQVLIINRCDVNRANDL